MYIDHLSELVGDTLDGEEILQQPAVVFIHEKAKISGHKVLQVICSLVTVTGKGWNPF